MIKVKVSFKDGLPIKQKLYYDVHRVQIYPDGVVAITCFDHVREVMEVALIRVYTEIEIF